MKNIIVFILSLLCCRSMSNEQFQSFLFSANFPLLIQQEDGVKLFFLKDSMRISYCGNYSLYEFPYHDLSFFDGNLTDEKIKLNPFLFKDGHKSGYFFASDTSSDISILSVDSMLSNRISWTKIKSNYDSNLIELSQIKTGNGIVKKFIPNIYNDETIFDTLFLYFKSPFNYIRFSFSTKLDSTTGMKLYKIRYLYNEKFLTKLKMQVPKRELLIEMIPDSATNKKAQEEKFEVLLKKLQLKFADI